MDLSSEPAMLVPAMGGPSVDHQKRFQVAVDVIHNLPKNGCYRPSYEVMLRFYSLYKQAVCGPCSVPQPAFWDPVGRYKWDAWSLLGEMSRESAMAAYVDEVKKVAQEVIDTVPMNEKTASLFHYFEPLYMVIDDMPRPPNSMLTVREDSGVSSGLVLINDTESEIFCDSVASVEQLRNTKSPAGFQKGHVSSVAQYHHPETGPEKRKTGAGKGGEGAEDGQGPGSIRKRRDAGQEGSDHKWRERGFPQGIPVRPNRGLPVSGGGAGRRGGDGSEGRAERLYDTQLQQQIILALQRLRENMRNVMDRLEVVERLSATHMSTPRTMVQGSEWRPCQKCEAIASEQEDHDIKLCHECLVNHKKKKHPSVSVYRCREMVAVRLLWSDHLTPAVLAIRGPGFGLSTRESPKEK